MLCDLLFVFANRDRATRRLFDCSQGYTTLPLPDYVRGAMQFDIQPSARILNPGIAGLAPWHLKLLVLGSV